MTIDAGITDTFGEVPEGIDLSANNAKYSDAGITALISVSLLSIVLRFGARIIQKAGFKADDYFIVGALVLTVASCVLTGKIFSSGGGRHVWALTPESIVVASKYLFALALTYSVAVWTLKASVIFLYTRLFLLEDKVFRRCIMFAAIASSVLCLAAIAVFLGACQPVSYFWDRFDGSSTGQCIDIGIAFTTIASFNVSLDFCLLAIPIPQILKLQMTSRKKLTVCTSLFLGIFVCVAGLVRIYYLVIFTGSRDYTWTLAPACIWLAVEPAIAIVTACIPNLLPLYHWCCEHIGQIRDGGENKNHVSSVSRSKVFDGHRLPTYDRESNLVLRPKDDDEICLTTMATAARNVSDESIMRYGIVVRSEVTQTIERN